MPIQFRKTSIKSRKRTLGLAGLGLIVETIVSHPRVDVTAMVNVAMMSRFAAAPLMASLGSLSRTAGPRSNDNVGTTPAASPDHMASICGRTRRTES
ncbi:hypothetical protein V1282_000587 [Nitrobacteraceae bacterium AZCC 2146]|jgi:hypothetical protein